MFRILTHPCAVAAKLVVSELPTLYGMLYPVYQYNARLLLLTMGRKKYKATFLESGAVRLVSHWSLKGPKWLSRQPNLTRGRLAQETLSSRNLFSFWWLSYSNLLSQLEIAFAAASRDYVSDCVVFRTPRGSSDNVFVSCSP